MDDTHTPSEHAGFDDWIEIFRAGHQTDSAGHTHHWTREELDTIVANFDGAHPAPLVIGHPETDSPAWGWASAIKRAGNTLLAKFGQVPEAVANAVREGRYRNRSVKLARGEAGYRLVHVGLLGAAPPAVEGLEPIAFEAEPEGITVQFNAVDGAGLSLIARGMQKLRELIVAHFGIDEADRYASQDDIDQLKHIADASANEPAPDAADSQPAYARHATEDPDMDQKLKDDLDAATKRATEADQRATEAETKLAEFSARHRVDEARQQVDTLLSEGRLTPAQAQGLPEFMATLEASDEFTFAAGEDTQSKTGAAFFSAFLAALPTQIELNKRHAEGEEPGDNAGDIVKAARQFQAAEHAKGNEIAWHEAVTHVTGAKA